MDYETYKSTATLDFQLEYIELFDGGLETIPDLSSEARDEAVDLLVEGEIDAALYELIYRAYYEGLNIRPLVRYIFSVWEKVAYYVVDMAQYFGLKYSEKKD